MSTSETEYRRQYRIANRERIRENNRQYRLANLDRLRDEKRQYAAEHRTQAQSRHKQWRESLKAKVLGHYGQVCACCGTEEHLGIDHVNGDGRAHRENLTGRQGRRTGGATYRLYQWLIDNGFPDGYQILCKPCNASKSVGEHCLLHQVRV